ncbi:MAG TPA: tetratricopeptide repeat protein [Thermoanaerobaculia bacterium]|nr:tetratricopeptide repeat protein [Thermoanaerobaculia bacterium]
MRTALAALLLGSLVVLPAFAADVTACRALAARELPGDDLPLEDTQSFFDEAEQAYRDCRSPELPVGVRVQALLKYSLARGVRGHQQSAVAGAREALQIVDRSQSVDPTLLLSVLDRLIAAETTARLRSDAVAHAKRALELQRATFGADSDEALAGQIRVGIVHIEFGELDQAESILTNAVRLAERKCGPQCQARSEAYTGMFVLRSAEGNEAEAKRFEELSFDAIPVTPRRKP